MKIEKVVFNKNRGDYKKNIGISLVLLIVIIIVLTIISAAVILTITNNNTLNQSQKVRIQDDLSKLVQELNDYQNHQQLSSTTGVEYYNLNYLNVGTGESRNIEYNGEPIDVSITNLFPSINSSKYKDRICVIKGKIYIDNTDNKLGDKEKEYIESLGIGILDKEILVIDKEEINLRVGQTSKISVKVFPQLESTEDLEFFINNYDICQVENGEKDGIYVVRGVKQGETQINISKSEFDPIQFNVNVNNNNNDGIYATGISLNKTNIKLKKGQTESLAANVSPSSANNNAIYWNSFNNSIASVNESGVVTGNNIGKTIVSANLNDIKAVCNVEVISPIELVANIESVGEQNVTLKINASTTYEKIQRIDINYKKKGTDNYSVSTIYVNNEYYNDNYTLGNLESNTEYDLKIVAIVTEEDKKEIDLTFKTNKIEVSSLKLNKNSIKLKKGLSDTLVATVKPDNLENKGVIWESSDEQVADVSDSGVVAGLKIGKAVIKAKSEADPSIYEECMVEVISPITLDVIPTYATETSISYAIETSTTCGTISEIRSRVLTKSNNEIYSNIEPFNNQSSCSYSETITNELNPDETYTIIVDSIGSDGSSARVTMEMTTQYTYVESISVNPTELTIVEGNTATIDEVEVLPVNATNKTYSFETSDNTIASVDQNGVITAQKEGTVVISAITNGWNSNGDNLRKVCNVTVTKAIAKIENTFYDNLQSAFNDTSTNSNLPSTIEMLADVTLNSNATLSSTKNAILDLKGMIIYNNSSSQCIINHGNLKITDSSTGGYIENSAYYTLRNNGILEIEDTYIENNSSSYVAISNANNLIVTSSEVHSNKNRAIICSDNSTLTVNGGTINGYNDGIYSGSTTSNITVNGGNIISQKNSGISSEGIVNVKSGEVTGIYVSGTGTLNLGTEGDSVSTESPKITNKKDDKYGVYNNGGKFYFYDGVIYSENTSTPAIRGDVTNTPTNYLIKKEIESDKNKVYLTKYTPVTSVSISSTLNIVAGNTVDLTATVSPSNASDKTVTWSSSTPSVATVTSTGRVKGISEGTAVITVTTNGKQANGKYIGGPITATCTVTVTKAIAKIGTTNYDNLQSAFDATSTNKSSPSTIEMLADVTLNSNVTLSITKNAILDLKGMTISNTTSSQCITNNGSLKITDSSTGGSIENSAYYSLRNNGILEVENTYIDNDSTSYYGIYSTNTVTVISGEVYSDNTAAIFCSNNTAKLKQYGGEIASSSSYGVNVSTGTFEQYGGYVEGSNGMYITTGTATINGTVTGKITRGGYISSSGSITVDNGTINGYTDGMYLGSTSSNVTVNGGNIISQNNSGISSRGIVNVKGGEVTGIYVWSTGTLNLGAEDDSVSTESPVVTNKKDGDNGVFNEGGTFNFYDGVIYSKNTSSSAINGNVTETPDGYIVSASVYNGKEKAILEPFDMSDEDFVNDTLIGSFVTYDAGTWTNAEMNIIKDINAENVDNVAPSDDITTNLTGQHEIGLFSAGTNRNKNLADDSNYDGWRIYNINDDGTFDIVSAGIVEYMRTAGTSLNLGWTSNAQAQVHTYIISGIKIGSSMSYHQYFKMNDYSMFKNSLYNVSNVNTILNKDILTFASKYDNSIDLNNTNRKIEFSNERYKNLLCGNGYGYYIPSSGVAGDCVGVINNNCYQTVGSGIYGIRVKMTVSSPIIKKVGTKTIDGYTYNVYELQKNS